MLEAIGLGLGLIGIGLAIFDGLSPFGAQNYPLAFLVLPVIIWAAFRFGQRGAATATFILSGVALWGTLHGFGPFVRDHPNESLLIGQLFLGTITLTGLSLATVVAERRQVEQALRLSHDQLAVILQNAAS